jgi:hypothetical protein
MVTDLVRAITFDVLRSGTQSLPASYPSVLCERFEDEQMQEVVKRLGSDESVLSFLPRLYRRGNVFAKALIKSLQALRDVNDSSTMLGREVARMTAFGEQYRRALDRELQSLLYSATGEDSPIVQVATRPTKPLNTKALPGIVSVQVSRSLLGGSRMFHNGKLNDQSWRARLMSILNEVNR